MKLGGCYRGHEDGLVVKAGADIATLGLPNSAGEPKEKIRLLSISKSKIYLRHTAMISQQ